MSTTRQDIQQALRTVLRTSPVRGHIRKISLFGSHLHGDAREDSDIDLLLEYNRPISLFDVIGLELDLKKKLGRKVDLRTPKGLSKYFREDVLNEAQALYEAG
jgi:uncharacterized protein